MDTILDLLDPQVLSSAYQQMQTTKPTLLGDTFLTNPEQIPGDSFELFIDPFESKPAPMNTPGAEARVIQASGADSKVQTLFASFNKLAFSEKVMYALREPDSPTLQRQGRTEIRRQMEHFKARQMLTKEVALAKILSVGTVYLNENGDILESSSGAVVSADFNIAAGHKSQLDWDGGGDLITASWATDGTSIATHIETIKIAAQKQGVPTPKHIWCNSNMKTHLRSNTEFQTWASASANISEQTAAGETIQGLFGMTWHFYDGTYQNASGTETLLIPDNIAIFTPDPTDSVFRVTQGLTMVPSQIGVTASIEEALGNLMEVYGEYAYAKLTDDPIQLLAYMGDKWGFHLADPNAIWIGTVVF